MGPSRHRFAFLVLAATAVTAAGAGAQRAGTLTPDQVARRLDTEQELASLAVVERKVMVPMRDGVRLATDVYRTKNATGTLPTIWVRTPYNADFWDVRNGVPNDMTQALTAVKRGDACVVQNERGHFFSDGNYDISQLPQADWSKALWHLPVQDTCPPMHRTRTSP